MHIQNPSFYCKRSTNVACTASCYQRKVFINVNTLLYIVQYYHFTLENTPKKVRALILQKSCFYNLMETELAGAVNVKMARTKIIYIFDNQR